METIRLDQVSAQSVMPMQTGIDYIDELLGGGITPGSTILASGMPGAGKSTLFIQVAYALTVNDKEVFYVAGEESPSQIKLRTERLGINSSKILFYEDTGVEGLIEKLLELRPPIVIIDSMQMLHTDTLKSGFGTPSQIRYCLIKLTQLAKKENIAIIFIGHSTKSGTIGGSQMFQHLVDTTLFIALNEDNTRTIKLFKNRFGSVEPTFTLYMTKMGIFDYYEDQKPFGVLGQKTLTLSESKVKKSKGKQIFSSILITLCLYWLKGQVKKSFKGQDVPLSYILSPWKIEKILKQNSGIAPIIRLGLKFMTNYANTT